MVKLRGEEIWASRCLSYALGGVEVRQHDDGSSPSMFDLEIMHDNRSSGAVEITAAADSGSIELWNLINGGGRWVESDLVGGWSVVLLPNARARRVQAELPKLLKQLELEGVRAVRANSFPRGVFEEAAHSLGMSLVFQSETAYPGSIYPTIDLPAEKSGGAVASTGDALAEWLSVWIRQPGQAHNLEKLRRSKADERHLVVILPGFADAPFVVTEMLMRDSAPLPTIPLRCRTA